jgi:hypothetical protein
MKLAGRKNHAAKALFCNSNARRAIDAHQCAKTQVAIADEMPMQK